MPKVFISYSWSSQSYKQQVKEWAERLLADGIDVVLDIFDLKEGDDKYAFMERLVTDDAVSHVLMLCDRAYSQKANARKAGVGTESQIISNELYTKVKQSKFIPVVTERADDGEPYLPTFAASRIWVDFSTPEAANKNWEQLVRAIYDRPIHQKPAIGKPPAYLDQTSGPANAISPKLYAFKQAMIQGKGVHVLRADLLDACFEYADALRPRTDPQVLDLGQKVVADAGLLKQVRNALVDWLLLEAPHSSESFDEVLLGVLERLLSLKGRPAEVTGWVDGWYEAHAVFVYETFLYLVAALVKTGSFRLLHVVLTSHYLRAEGDRSAGREFDSFLLFYHGSDFLQSTLAPKGRDLHSPVAELLRRQADRTDLPFASINEADGLTFFMALLNPEVRRWYPQTLLYWSFKAFPLFMRAQQRRGFEKLSIVTGVKSAVQIKDLVDKGLERHRVDNWGHFWMRGGSFADCFCLARLNSIQ